MDATLGASVDSVLFRALVLVCAVALLLVLGIVLATISVKYDAREPPLIQSTVPYIGHLLGMWWYGPTYYQRVNKSNYPIYTLPMLGGRSYIVSAPSLVSLIQRNTKTLSFYSVIVEVTRRFCAFDKDATKIIFHNMNQEHGPGASVMSAAHEMMNRNLGPGPVLDAITTVQLNKMSEMLAPLAMNSPEILNLYRWVQHSLTICNGYAIYGPENIFAKDPSIAREFWTFEDGILGLVIDFLPWLTARKAYLARKRLFKALVSYIKEHRYKSASPLIRERVAINRSFGLSEEMIGHGELVLHFGILGNAVPTIFWLIMQIFTRPQLLQEIREELEDALTFSTDKSMRKQCTISSDVVKTCPRLFSCYRETLRHVSIAVSPRLVLSETMLAGKYLLRAGSIVQIQGGMLHQDTSIWGENAAAFDPDRFLTPPNKRSAEEAPAKDGAVQLPKGVPSTAFRSFGGGSTLCPGRFFAQSEIMTFVAAMVLGFNINSLSNGELKVPARDEWSTTLALMKPMKEPTVLISRREGWEDVALELVLGHT